VIVAIVVAIVEQEPSGTKQPHQSDLEDWEDRSDAKR
jgi:hypothetical protein